MLGDPEFEHIGIGLGSLISSAVAPAPAPSTLLGSRNFHMLVEYHSPTQLLEMRIAATTSLTQESTFKRPKNPTLAARMNFPAVVQDLMYVGFSSAVRSCSEGTRNTTTGGCTRATAVLAWSLETFSWDSNATVAHLPNSGWRVPCFQKQADTIVVFLAVVGIAVLVAAALYFYFRWDLRDRRRWKFDADANLEAWPHQFSHEELSIATKEFKSTGREGFWQKCTRIMGRIRHRNSVRLQGWCNEKNEFLLVYDYLSGAASTGFSSRHPKAPETSFRITWFCTGRTG